MIRGIGFYGNCFGVPTVGGEVVFEPCYSNNPLVNALALGIARREDLFFARAQRRGQSGDLCRRENRPRRHSRRVAARLGGIQRGIAAEAAQRAGGRSVHGKAAARSVPRSDAHRRGGRDSGHGRGRADQFEFRNGFARRRGNRNRPGARAAARNGHDALRNHAQRIAGAHAAGCRARPRTRSFRRVSTNGDSTRWKSAASPTTASCAC